jgi:quinol monooxygenase YgiN
MKLFKLASLPSYRKVPTLAREAAKTTILTIVALAASATTFACSSSPSGAGLTAGDSGLPGNGKDAGAHEAATEGGEAAPKPAAAFFRGTLARSVAASKAFSDPFFTGVKAEAMGAGDDGHDALLGTTDLGTTLDQFVGLDTWSTDAKMDAVYSSPPVLAFGKSFYASPPEFVTFYPTDFYQWGNTDSGDGSTPHYFVMVRGLYKDTPENIKLIHDPFAKSIQAEAKANGLVSHIVYYGRKEPEQALIVDIWTSRASIDEFYSNAAHKSSLDSLFDATGPNYGVYSSTDWVTW